MRILSMLLSSFVVAPAAAAQTTWYVDAAGCDGAGDGTAADPFCSIQEALDAAASGDKIVLAPGVHDGQISVPPIEVGLVGAAGAELTVLQSSAQPLMEVAPGAHVMLRELTITQPPTDKPSGDRFRTPGIRLREAAADIEQCRFLAMIGYSGGAILADDSDLRLRDCRFEENAGEFGGSVAARGGTLLVDGCLFRGSGPFDSRWSEGGALWLRDVHAVVSSSLFAELGVFAHASAIRTERGSLLVEESMFIGNYVEQYAGTIAVIDADALIRRCVFRDNDASLGWGGAIYVSVGDEQTVLLQDLRLSGNHAADGGAVFVRRGHAEVTGCRFDENHAFTGNYSELGYGGALVAAGSPGPPGAGSALVTRCTFVKNSARGHSFVNAGKGGAVYGPVLLENCTFFGNSVSERFGPPDVPVGGAVAGPSTLHNCIVWESQPQAFEDGTIATWSLVQGSWPGEGNLALDPGLVDPSRGDLHLLPTSPCIDRGDPDEVDSDGTRIDIGAFPFDPLHGAFSRRGARAP